jgi:hypothetical protein
VLIDCLVVTNRLFFLPSIRLPRNILAYLKMEAVQSLPPHQQQQFMAHLEQMQLKDSLT